MKLITYVSGMQERLGILYPTDDNLVIDILSYMSRHHFNKSHLGQTLPVAFHSLQNYIEAGEDVHELTRTVISEIAIESPDVFPLSSLTLRAPIPVPVQFRDCLLFEEHLKNSFAALRKTLAAQASDPESALEEFNRRRLYHVPEVWYEIPVYYKVNRFSFIGPNQDIEWPNYSNRLDYELEYAVVLGKRVKNATLEQAADAIFGYTIFNDISARDTQAKEMQAQLGPSKGKDFDTGNIIGPCIVTKDEFDPSNATMLARINGEEVCRGNTGSAYWSFPQVIKHASHSETLMPGEFFGSGTVGGGCALENGRFLQPGDEIEFEVSGIGLLKNRVIRR